MARDTDPLLGFTFGVDFSGKAEGLFTECSGLTSESEIVDHKVVDKQGKEFIQKIPGRLKWGDITLKRGITKSMDFWTWRKEVEDGKIQTARTNGSIIMYDREYNPAARWDVERAWPSKLSGPTAKADSNEFGVEEVVIVFEAYKRVQ